MPPVDATPARGLTTRDVANLLRVSEDKVRPLARDRRTRRDQHRSRTQREATLGH